VQLQWFGDFIDLIYRYTPLLIPIWIVLIPIRIMEHLLRDLSTGLVVIIMILYRDIYGSGAYFDMITMFNITALPYYIISAQITYTQGFISAGNCIVLNLSN
jgi:hypothetical protein